MDNVNILIEPIIKEISITPQQSSNSITIKVNSKGELNTINSLLSGEPSGSDQVLNIVSLTQAEYNAGTPKPATFYIITD